MAHKILLVEDEENLASAILLNLELEGYKPTWIKNGELAISNLTNRSNFYDLVILDVMLPEKDGFTICKSLRNHGIKTPVLFLSARNTSEDKIEGLKAGANDYVGKPFHLEELLLRVKVLIEGNSNSKEQTSTTYKIGQSIFYNKSLQIETISGQKIQLTKTEGQLLQLLINHANEIVSRDDIFEHIWKNRDQKSRTMDNMIVKFRRILENDPKNPQHLKSIRGVGYQLIP
jgi:two-component system alkaline phosphatase synthesis response regulator PhoP